MSAMSRSLRSVTAPAVSGNAVVGETLAATPGQWSMILLGTTTYQWLRNGLPVAGATV